jgi:hypothetical protein
MARHDSPEPIEIVDRLLWRDAQQMLDRHAQADPDGRCEWCGWHWPCPPRRLAERAEVAARRPWRESWTARHDLHGRRTLPSWRAEQSSEPPAHTLGLMPTLEEAPNRGAPVHTRRNSGLFD